MFIYFNILAIIESYTNSESNPLEVIDSNTDWLKELLSYFEPMKIKNAFAIQQTIYCLMKLRFGNYDLLNFCL